MDKKLVICVVAAFIVGVVVGTHFHSKTEKTVKTVENAASQIVSSYQK